MLLNVLKGKIHRARVVQAELDYVGSNLQNLRKDQPLCFPTY